ncbi:MAG: helix-turn-helix domain-containing protein [Nitrospira sp. CG24D]|nr:MAG: helix-turn-helix domain-containing protein [Nitrospira sp. CG24D]
MALYRRLTLMEREELSRMLAAGYSLRATAQAMQRAPSTVSRELARHQAGRRGWREWNELLPGGVDRLGCDAGAGLHYGLLHL